MSDVTWWIKDARRDWEALRARHVEPARVVEDESTPPRKYCATGFIPRCRNLERPSCCLFDETAQRWIEPDHRPCKTTNLPLKEVGRRLSTGPLCRDEALILAGELVEASLSWPSYAGRVVQGLRVEASK